MKFKILKTKRARIFAAITLFAIALMILLNLLLYSVGLNKAVFFDMTPEGLYTLSDEMIEECDKIFDELAAKSQSDTVKKKIKVTFCTDVDYLMANRDTRLTYLMALKIQNRYPGQFEVKTENVRLNPTSVSEYKTTSLTQIRENNVIVSYGERYRIVTDGYFWTSGTKDDEYYNGEYRIASLMKSVSSIARPAAYFVKDHLETYYDPANKDSEASRALSSFASILVERGLEIKTLDLSSVDRIPEDCALLIINNPKQDFIYDESQINSLEYVSDIEKIDRYLVMRQGAIMVSKDYRVSLPIFESFLYEWGFDFSSSVVVDKESSLEDEGNTGTNIIGIYDTNEDSYGYALYGEYADLSSAPLTIVKDTGSIKCSFVEAGAMLESGTSYASRDYVSFLTTSSSAQKYFRDENDEITSYIDGNAGKFDIAALSVRNELNSIENVSKFSYMFCVNSASFLENSLLGDSSYANYEIVSAVVENISRVDEHASMDLGALSFNSKSGGGKYIIDTSIKENDNKIVSNKYEDNDRTKPLIVIKENHGMSSAAKTVYTVFVFAIPALIGIAGIYVCLKRRFL